jgi:hypothetical protein
MGLFFFFGCNLSNGASLMSFKTYTALEATQKAATAKKDIRSAEQSKNLFEKIRGAITKRFFTHCFILSNLKMSSALTPQQYG